MSTDLTFHRCDRCSRFVFIPTPISPTPTTTFYCPDCNTSPPTTTSTRQFDLVQNYDDLVSYLTQSTFSYEPRPTPAATSFINSLKNRTLDSRLLKQLNTPSSSCAICSEEFKLAESVNRLPCRHWFHCDCLGKWLNLKNNCPLCRHEFPSEPDRVDRRPISSAAAMTSTSEDSSQTSAAEARPVRVRRTARMRTSGWIPNRRLAEDNLNSYTRIHIVD